MELDDESVVNARRANRTKKMALAILLLVVGAAIVVHPSLFVRNMSFFWTNWSNKEMHDCPIVLSVRLQSPTAHIGGTIAGEAVIKNCSITPLTIVYYRDPIEYLSIEILDMTNTVVWSQHCGETLSIAFLGGKPLVVEPNQSLVLSFGPCGPLASSKLPPGLYRIRCSYYLDNQFFFSSPTELVLLPAL